MNAKGVAILVIVLSLVVVGECYMKIESVEKKLSEVTSEMANLKWEKYVWSPYQRYMWFQLGQPYYQIVDNRFYVSNITATFHDNGFDVSGVIANLDAVEKNTVKLQCAIKDSSVAGLLTTGFIEISSLYPGFKWPFTVFVPTKQTKVSEIGVTVVEYRM